MQITPLCACCDQPADAQSTSALSFQPFWSCWRCIDRQTEPHTAIDHARRNFGYDLSGIHHGIEPLHVYEDGTYVPLPDWIGARLPVPYQAADPDDDDIAIVRAMLDKVSEIQARTMRQRTPTPLRFRWFAWLAWLTPRWPNPFTFTHQEGAHP